MDDIRFDRLARLVATRSRRHVLRGLAGTMAAALLGSRASAQQDCDAGYRDDGFGCEDIDECSEGSDNCDQHATCSNTEGGFTCSCDDG